MKLRLSKSLVSRYKLIKKRCVFGVRMVLHKYSRRIIVAASVVFFCFVVVVGAFAFLQDSHYKALMDHGVTTIGYETSRGFGHEITYEYKVNGTFYKRTFSDYILSSSSIRSGATALSYLPEKPSFSAPAKNLDGARKDSMSLFVMIIVFAVLIYVNVFWLNVLGKHIR